MLNFLKQPLPTFKNVTEAEKFRQKAEGVRQYFAGRAIRATDFNQHEKSEIEKRRVRIAELAVRYGIESVWGNNTDDLKEEYCSLQINSRPWLR